MSTNIEHHPTPGELYDTLSLRRKWGSLKESAGNTEMTYGYIRHFMSTMDRLHPDMRCEVGKTITVKQARLLAQLPSVDQNALYEAKLTPAELRLAVEIVRDKKVTPEEAVRRVKSNAILRYSITSATFFAQLATIAMGGILFKKTLEDLGFSESTAKRTVRELRRSKIIDENNLITAEAMGMMRKTVKTTPINISTGFIFKRLIPVSEMSEAKFEDFVSFLRSERRQSS